MSKPASKPTERRMEYVEITQAEEMPVLSAEEKAELIASLVRARGEASRGEGISLRPEEIGHWLRAGLERARQRRRDGA
jgi:hypothetical protein